VYLSFFKRVLDTVIGAICLVALFPVMIAVWLAVRVTLGAPALFRQTRPGLGGRPFTIVKFRTMREDGGNGDDAQRLTALGRWLRSTSLDELPELWNVVRGDMSLVGPRPLLTQYLSRYSPRQATRHVVRPGITGLAQAHGRNNVSWEQRLELDVHYAERVSLSLDLWILWRTVVIVCLREGISEPGQATASEFLGSTSTGIKD
jgi:lipopolysaccharide/colanic/teichoic acid biosynthesis glycosyltransferase